MSKNKRNRLLQSGETVDPELVYLAQQNTRSAKWDLILLAYEMMRPGECRGRRCMSCERPLEVYDAFHHQGCSLHYCGECLYADLPSGVLPAS